MSGLRSGLPGVEPTDPCGTGAEIREVTTFDRCEVISRRVGACLFASADPLNL